MKRLSALALFLWQHALMVRLTERVFRVFSPRLGGLLARKVDSVADGIRSIGDARLAAAFLAETLVYWGTNACFMWVLGLASGLINTSQQIGGALGIACGVPLSLGHAVAVMGVLALGILLPSGPGMFGSFQVAASAALKLYFPEGLVGSEGAVFVFLLYGLNALMMVLVGVGPLLRMHVRMSDLLAPRVSDTMPPPGVSG